MEKMKDIDKYLVDLEYAKFASTLRNTKIVASDNTYIIVAVKSNMEMKTINDYQMSEGYETFFLELLGKPKKVFAITFEQQTRAINAFKERMIAGTLPEPCEVVIQIEKSPVSSTLEDQIKDIFPTVQIMKG